MKIIVFLSIILPTVVVSYQLGREKGAMEGREGAYNALLEDDRHLATESLIYHVYPDPIEPKFEF